MQLTYLLVLSCLLCVSVCGDRDTINRIEEFKKYFSDYTNQTSANSNKTLFPILRNQGNVCPCAHEFLKKLNDSLSNQNNTDNTETVLMMQKILTSLQDQVQKISRKCNFKKVTASVANNFETFFQRFLSLKCMSQSKKKIG